MLTKEEKNDRIIRGMYNSSYSKNKKQQCIYHVIMRGINQQRVFENEEGFERNLWLKYS